IGDAEHREVPKRVEIVLCESTLSGWLGKRDQCPFISKITDQSTKVGVRIVDLTDVFNHLPVVKTEPGSILDEFDIRKTIDRFVIRLPNKRKQGGLLGVYLLCQDDLVSPLPLTDELRDHLGR